MLAHSDERKGAVSERVLPPQPAAVMVEVELTTVTKAGNWLEQQLSYFATCWEAVVSKVLPGVRSDTKVSWVWFVCANLIALALVALALFLVHRAMHCICPGMFKAKPKPNAEQLSVPCGECKGLIEGYRGDDTKVYVWREQEKAGEHRKLEDICKAGVVELANGEVCYCDKCAKSWEAYHPVHKRLWAAICPCLSKTTKTVPAGSLQLATAAVPCNMCGKSAVGDGNRVYIYRITEQTWDLGKLEDVVKDGVASPCYCEPCVKVWEESQQECVGQVASLHPQAPQAPKAPAGAGVLSPAPQVPQAPQALQAPARPPARWSEAF